VAGLLAPDGDDLGHDAGQVRVHEAGIQATRRAFGGEVEDRDMEALLHAEDPFWIGLDAGALNDAEQSSGTASPAVRRHG
jgi:hypothetical protein